MTSNCITNLASELLQIFHRTLSFFQNIGILQDYSFNHSNAFFSPDADKYLDNFVSLLEEVKGVLEKLQALQKQAKSVQVDTTNTNANVVSGDLIPTTHFIQNTDMFVTDQLITPGTHELGNLIAPTCLLSNEIIIPEIIIPEVIEPTTQSSWLTSEEKEKENIKKSPVNLKEKKYECSVCNKILSSKNSLNFHEATHKGQKLFCCEHCGKLFTTSVNLAAHLTRQHNLNTESANSCKECGKLFVRKSALETHMKGHQGFRQWACGLCSKTFTQKVTRDTHQLTHTRDYKYSCDECNRQFPTQAKLNFHSKTHGEPQFMCNLCDKKFATKQYLNAHYRTHDLRRSETAHCRLDTISTQIVENTTFHCSQCSRSFPSQHTLTQHVQKHNPLSARYRYLEKRKLAPRQKYRCNVCGKEFLLESSLTHHERQNHSPELTDLQKRPFSCHLCQKTFTLRAKAKQHMLIHSQQAHHGCNVCGQRFRRKDSLQRHLTMHTGAVVCKVCHHTSSSRSEHREHAKTHASHVKCSQCDKAFLSKNALAFHIQIHEGKFQYQCSICGKQFVRKCHYQCHLLSHSSDRPYKCEHCGKSFKDNKHCKEHSKRVHVSQIINTTEQISNTQMTVSQMAANEIAASQIAIHTLLAGDDATYGQTYDQFQACVQLQ